MKNLLIVFFVVFAIFMIFMFPFKIRIMGHFNLVKFVGFFFVKIFIFKISNAIIQSVDGKIKIDSSVNFFQKNFNKNFSKKMAKNCLNKIDVKKFEVFFKGGIADNSFASAILCGGVCSAVQSFFSILSQNFYNVKLYEDVDAKFGNDNLELTFDIVLSINLLSIFLSIFQALFSKNKEELK